MWLHANMLMRSWNHSNVRFPLMVMVMVVVSLRQVYSDNERTGGNGASDFLQKLRRDQDEWFAIPPLNVKKPAERTDRMFQQLDEFDRLGDASQSAPANDIGSIWGFGFKSKPAQQPKESKMNYLLSYSRGKEIPMGTVMKNFDEKKHESTQQREELEQRHREMEIYKNAAADLAFERMMNMQRERTEGAKAVILPLFPAAKPSGARPSLAKPVPANPSVGKIFPLFPAAYPSAARPTLTKPVPAKPSNGKIHLLSKTMWKKPTLSSPATPRPGTCPATTFRPPTTAKHRFGDSSKPKPSKPQKGPSNPLTQPSRAKCKHVNHKKKPPVSSASAKLLEAKILAMKQHALSILKNLNYLEMEVLSQSPNTCPRHQSQGKGENKCAIPKKKTKIGERLDRPTQPFRAKSKLHRGFFFGIRPANAKERLADLAAAREEELKLRGRVWREHLQHLMARKRPFFKPKRYEPAPAAAARLEPVEPKPAVDTQLNLKLRPTSAPAQPVEDPAGRMPMSSESSSNLAKQFAIRNYELVPKKMNSTNRQPARRRKKKRKKMMLALRPTDDNPIRG